VSADNGRQFGRWLVVAAVLVALTVGGSALAMELHHDDRPDRHQGAADRALPDAGGSATPPTGLPAAPLPAAPYPVRQHSVVTIPRGDDVDLDVPAGALPAVSDGGDRGAPYDLAYDWISGDLTAINGARLGPAAGPPGYAGCAAATALPGTITGTALTPGGFLCAHTGQGRAAVLEVLAVTTAPDGEPASIELAVTVWDHILPG
jgi:hypothetical protein